MKRPADTLWSNKLFRVKLATGWSNTELAKQARMDITTVRKVFAGFRPTMPVIIKIKSLEFRRASDLAALDKGRISFDQYGWRVDWDGDRRSRPRDLKDLGNPVGVENRRRPDLAPVGRVGRLPRPRRPVVAQADH